MVFAVSGQDFMVSMYIIYVCVFVICKFVSLNVNIDVYIYVSIYTYFVTTSESRLMVFPSHQDFMVSMYTSI
jgi:hypothetical protein